MYPRALAAAATPLGQPPAAFRAIGAAPPRPSGPQHTEPPPYDVAHDPAWAGHLDPNNAPLRAFLNEITPEQRQMLLQEVMKLKGTSAPTPPAMGVGTQPPPVLPQIATQPQ